jgi:hypothetical protein
MDDAIFSRNGSPNGSVAGDFRQAGIRTMRPADKANVPMEAGLGKLRSRMAASRQDCTSPWLLWSSRCQGLEQTLPNLARDPNHVERLAPGQPDHAADALRYAVCLVDSQFACGPTSFRMW